MANKVRKTLKMVNFIKTAYVIRKGYIQQKQSQKTA